ncbi:MAG: HD domain-containing protein [Polyangiaceae bacterium]
MFFDELLSLLTPLDGVRQDPKYHPEGDALFHSLQVFDCARRDTTDPILLGAALLHDVGKVLGSSDHDATGADLLDGLVHPRVVFLVRHHLDLLRAPGKARRRHTGRDLADLTMLRRWDLAGRAPNAHASTPEDAVTFLLEQGGEAALSHDHAEDL